MDEMEMQRQVTQLQSTVDMLSRQYDEILKKTTDVAGEQHIIKHDLKNINANFTGITNLLERNQTVQSEIRDMLLKSNFQERLVNNEAFQKAFESITTMKNFSGLFDRMEKGELFITRAQTWWIILSTLGSLIGGGIVTVIIKMITK